MAIWDHIDRRLTRDWWTRISRSAVLGVWALLVTAMVLYYKASPERDTVYNRFRDTSVRADWDTDLVPWLFGVLLAAFVFSVIFGAASTLRIRREGESVPVSYWLVGISSGVALSAMAIYFYL